MVLSGCHLVFSGAKRQRSLCGNTIQNQVAPKGACHNNRSSIIPFNVLSTKNVKQLMCQSSNFVQLEGEVGGMCDVIPEHVGSCDCFVQLIFFSTFSATSQDVAHVSWKIGKTVA